jgi:hypothetical protein
VGFQERRSDAARFRGGFEPSTPATADQPAAFILPKRRLGAGRSQAARLPPSPCQSDALGVGRSQARLLLRIGKATPQA